MMVDYRAAQSVPRSFDGFRSELGRQGFTHAAETYAAFQKDEPHFALEELAINTWADELIEHGHYPEAVALLELTVRLYPESDAAYENLGDAYSGSGQNKLAIDCYRQAIEKNPVTTASRVRKIEALKGPQE
jgi:tetratricopeptide (TPR) repeat protein